MRGLRASSTDFSLCGFSSGISCPKLKSNTTEAEACATKAAPKIYFTSLFSAQTYSLICQSGFNLKILWAVQVFVYAFESSIV
jgi:hypothetical protein